MSRERGTAQIPRKKLSQMSDEVLEALDYIRETQGILKKPITIPDEGTLQSYENDDGTMCKFDMLDIYRAALFEHLEKAILILEVTSTHFDAIRTY